MRLGVAIALLTALLWKMGALAPRSTTAVDLQWYFLPTYEAFFGALGAGAPMWWNPYQLCGTPWVGTLQGGFFYPPHLAYLLLPAPWALGLTTVAHLALAAGGTAVFARRIGLSPAASALAAGIFAFAGPLRRMQLWPYFLEATAWLPIGALAVHDLAHGRTRRGAIALALASGMSWLAGSPQATVLACYVWAALLAALLLGRRSDAPVVSAVGGMAAGLAMGAMLAAVTLLPALEVARNGVRSTSALDVASMFPVGIPSVAHVWQQWRAPGPHVLLLGALALAPFALLSGSRALVLWGLTVVGLAAAFALGPATPLFEVYRRLPAIGWFRAPQRVLIAAQFPLAILAALGADTVARRLRWRRVMPLAVVALLLAATFEGLARRDPTPPLYDRGWTPYAPAHREAYAELATTIGGQRVWPFSPGLGQYALNPKLPTLTHLRSVTDYEPLTLRRQFEYFLFFDEGRLRAPRHQDANRSLVAWASETESPAARRRLMDLAAVKFLLVPPPTSRRADVAAFVRDGGWLPRSPLAGELHVYENPRALPRAFVTYRARTAPPAEDLLPQLARDSFDPLAESFVEGSAALPPTPDAPARGAPARIVRDDADVVEIEATLAAPGLVVLADTYHPGWTATVDGAPAPILPTNHLFRGVPAPAGTHRIRFAYGPRSLGLGAALSLLTALALAAGAYRLKTRPAT